MTLAKRGFPAMVVWMAVLGAARANLDEGMLPISELSRLDLAERGFRLRAEELFSPTGISLADGICRVNGCTGSFVSPDGLILTNHHCAYEAIQNASSAEKDHLQNGFRAAIRGDEIPAPGYTVRITESFEDVSNRVLEVVREGMPHGERTAAIDKRRKELEREAEAAEPNLRAEVAEMFTGKTWILFRYTYLKDVRLVFAPPASVGTFGGDIDNWEWPRHTGDFSFLRAYVAPDGSSADYAAENVPYRPKRWIQVNPGGADEGDLVFLLGYPGRTVRHRTASFVRYEMETRLPWVVEWYGWQLQRMAAASKEDRSVALKLTSTIQSLANVEKRSRGQLSGLRRTTILADREAAEQRLLESLAGDPPRRDRCRQLLSEMDEVYRQMRDRAPLEMRLAALRGSCRTLGLAFGLYDSAVERQKDDLERESPYMDRNWDQTVQGWKLTRRDLHGATDQTILREVLRRLYELPEARALPPLAAVFGSGEAASVESRIESWVASAFEHSRIADEGWLAAAIGRSPDELQAEGDPLLELIIGLYPTFKENRDLDKAREGRLSELYGPWIDLKQLGQKDFIPDANGTLRLTFGRIKGYRPQDAVYKSPITTLRGVVEKTTGEEPFVTPRRILEMHAKQQFGGYRHPRLGDLPVGILYDTDTTGGNSGSPVLDADGRLVGVNFDRAFEATINDFAWNAEYSRSLGVDIRYVLWITGSVFEAQELLHEMGAD